MRRKLAAAVVATTLAAVLAAPVFAGHQKLRSGSAIVARSGSGIVAAKF
jgi:hypothetical protein